MFVGRVIGEVWASRQVSTLAGFRLLLIDPLELEARPGKARVGVVVAADNVGAGVGERVIVAFGRAARVALERGQDIAVEAAVVGIVDDMTTSEALRLSVTPPGGRAS
jgi:ethanolamine utilization protein EutN